MGAKPKLNSELPSSWRRIIMITEDVCFEILVCHLLCLLAFQIKSYSASKKIKSKKIWEVQASWRSQVGEEEQTRLADCFQLRSADLGGGVTGLVGKGLVQGHCVRDSFAERCRNRPGLTTSHTDFWYWQWECWWTVILGRHVFVGSLNRDRGASCAVYPWIFEESDTTERLSWSVIFLEISFARFTKCIFVGVAFVLDVSLAVWWRWAEKRLVPLSDEEIQACIKWLT